MANIALGKLTSQSSTKLGVDDQSFTSSWAVDGAIDGSPHSHFAHTDAAYTAGASSWWMIDLEREYTVLKFSVYPRPAAYDFPSEFARLVWCADVNIRTFCTYIKSWPSYDHREGRKNKKIIYCELFNF